MTPVAVNDVMELRELVGTPIGPTGWREVTQLAVDDFARISGDGRWIHTDPERARRESPFGGPLAHGNVTLATSTRSASRPPCPWGRGSGRPSR